MAGADGCWKLSPGGLAGPSLLMWEHGTAWEVPGESLRLPNGQIVRAGDEILASGGTVESDQVTPQLTQGCDAGNPPLVVVLFQVQKV